MLGEEIVCTIVGLSYGVFGVARDDRGTVLVPRTAPGDVVRARIVEEKRDYREAELVELLEPSPDRRTPPCPYVPECGGCTWQHLDYPAQLRAKEEVLRSTLARLGGLDSETLDLRPIIASTEWGYRHRVTLRVDGADRLGFYRHRSHRLVEIDHCLIADATVNTHLAVAREWLRGVSTSVRRVEIASAGDGRAVLVANAEGAYRHDGEYHEAFLRRQPTLAGIVLFGRSWRHSFGKPRVALALDGELEIGVEGGFTQVNTEGNRRLVEAVLELAAPRSDDRALDLYCGAGNLTLPLARRVREVVGVESERAGIEGGRANADTVGIRNVRFVQQTAAVAARGLAAERERFSLIVLDPPRSGAADVVEPLARIGPERIVYVSCNPATLARDLKALVVCGYRVGPLQPIDLFPQTHHIETVVRLTRK